MPGQVNPSASKPTSRPNVWDAVAENTDQDRDVCKKVMYALLYGADVVNVMCHNSLELCHVTDIRMAFDRYTTNWKQGR